ncbi:MAG: class I SAM-dependent methyltransferase [Pirellulaceae bacterium]
MVNKANRSEKQLASIKEVCQRLAEKLDARISLRLWDGSLHPLGSNVLEGYEISISGPGVIGAMIRRPTAENLLCLYARGHVDFQGANIVEFMRTARVKGSRRRSRSIPKLLAAKAFFNFAAGANVDASSELRFQGDDQGFHRKQSDNRDFIKFHYDIGNEFYKLFLDKEMVYSCAYFRSWDESLEQAQRNKLDMICRKLQLKPGDRMLDIGCGWGALICYAAEHYGVKAHGITLSDGNLNCTSASRSGGCKVE